MSAVPDLGSDKINAGKLKGSKFLTGAVKEFWVLELMKPIEDFCARNKITPNQITSFGFFLTLLAALALATNHLIWGGWLLIFGGCCDFLDGRIARRMNLLTESGAFYDSVLDRYMDAAGFFALAYLFRNSWVEVLVFLGILGSTTTPYIRAKAEALGLDAKGGEMQRPERVVYIGVGSLLSAYLNCSMYPFLEKGEELPPYFLIFGLFIVAWMSNKTAIQRFWSVFKTLKARA